MPAGQHGQVHAFFACLVQSQITVAGFVTAQTMCDCIFTVRAEGCIRQLLFFVPLALGAHVKSALAMSDIAQTNGLPGVDLKREQRPPSAVSWGAIFAGAAAAAALSLILLILGMGLGLSSLSPWAHEGISAATLGVATILWITFTQLVASGLGGYIAGRLRTKWIAVHTDEVYFRDTVHGFLAWSVASLASAALLTSVTAGIVGGGVQAGANLASGVVSTASVAAASGTAASGSHTGQSGNPGALDYFVDSLFRADSRAAPGSQVPAVDPSTAVPTAEVSRIFMNTLRVGELPADDVRYVGQLVAQRTGLTQAEAEQRVRDLYARARETLRRAEITAQVAADKTRKASAYTALWLFISLLIGAFVASLSATFGGRRRDLV